MNKVYIIFNGCYSDIGWHGFFLTEEEARAYCDWKNQYARDSWDEYWYSDVDLLSLKKEQKETTRAYKVITHDYEIGRVEPLRVGKGTKNEYILEVHEGYYPLSLVAQGNLIQRRHLEAAGEGFLVYADLHLLDWK